MQGKMAKDKKGKEAKGNEAGDDSAAAPWECSDCGQENEPLDVECCACEVPRSAAAASGGAGEVNVAAACHIEWQAFLSTACLPDSCWHLEIHVRHMRFPHA